MVSRQMVTNKAMALELTGRVRHYGLDLLVNLKLSLHSGFPHRPSFVQMHASGMHASTVQ